MSENWARASVFDEGQRKDYRHFPRGQKVFYVRPLRGLFVWFQCGVGFYLVLSKASSSPIPGEICPNMKDLLYCLFFGVLFKKYFFHFV